MESENQKRAEENVEDVTKLSDTKESEGNIFSTIGYIIPILFFVPLLDEKTKEKPFIKFHANQQLIILILFVALQFLHMTILMMLGALGYLVLNVISLALFALAVIGALNAHKGQMKELPLVGNFRILN